MPTRRLAPLAGLLLCALLFAPAAMAQTPTFTVSATSGPAPAPEGHIRVSWTRTGTPGELYVIRRILYVFNQPPVDQGVIAVRPEADSTYLDANTLPGTTYEYCITPQTSGTPEACASGYRDLRRPRNLQATDSTRTDGVAMTWVDLSSVEVGYVVFRDAPGTPTGNPATLTPIDTTTADATGYLDNTGVAGQRYQYCVGLLDGFGGVQTVIPPLACDVGTRGVVAPPTGVAASDGTLDDRVRVVWTVRPSVTYSVYRNIVGQPRSLLASNLTAQPYEDLTAVALQPYTYCVTATNAQGESVPVCDAGQRGGLARPDSLVVSYDTSDSAVELSWNDPGLTETGFRLYRQQSLPIGGPEEFVAEVPANRTRYSDTEAVPGRTYDFSIEAIATVRVNGVDVTTASQRRYGQNVGRRAELLPPTAFTATDAATGNEAYVELAWETESDVVQLFQVFRDGVPLATLAPFARGYRDETGLAGTTYAYHVRAVSVVDLDPALVKQGLAPIFARAAANRTALSAERAAARESKSADLARLGERAEAEEAALVREIQEVLTGMGADASKLSDPESVTGTLVTRDSDPDDGSRLVRAPGSVAATTDLEDRIRLTWTDRSSIETFHQIQATYGPYFGETYTLGPNQTEWVDIAAPAGIDVQYQIRTLDGDDASVASFSEWVPVTGRRRLLPPGRVTAAQDLVETELVVAWRDSSRAEDGYRVLANLSTGWWIGEAPANTRQLVVPIQPEDFGTDIPVKVMAYSDEDRSSVPLDPMIEPTYTGSAQVETTAMPRLLPPSVVTASTGYSTRVVVSWTDESSANDGYRVTRGGVEVAALGDETTYSDDTATGQAPYCVTATTSGQPAADSPTVCATGRLSTVIAASTGDEVSTPRFSSALNATASSPGIGGGASYGKAVASDGANAVVSTDVDAQTLSHGIASGWAIPWVDNANQFPYGTGGYYNGTVKGRVGMASFYERSESGWAEINRIQIGPNDPFTYGEFGYDADVHGDVAIIGAPGAATFVTHPRNEASVLYWTRYQSEVTFGDGGAYIYTKNGSGDWVRSKLLRLPGYGDNQFGTRETGYESQTSQSSNDANCTSNFGEIPPNGFGGLLVGGHTSSRCRPYYRTAGGSFLTATVVDRTYTTPISRMGSIVALTPDWAFVSYIENGAHTIGRFQASQNWAHQGSLTPPPSFNAAGPSSSLAASPEALAVGSGVGNRVHLHSVSPTGVTTSPFVIDRPQDRGYDERFGTSVDVRGDLLVVGAPELTGFAYVYRKAPASFVWTLEQTLSAPPTAGDLGFGQDVAITDGIIAVSAVATNGPGVVYTFRQNPDTDVWEQVARLSEEGGGQNYFGLDIAATGEDLVIGSPATTTTDGVTGAVYFATLSTPPGNVQASDGRYANRVQVRWEDQAVQEDGHRIYRLGPTDTDYVLVGTVDPNIEIFDDFDVAPGDAYSYCVASFFGEDESDTNPLGESGRTCDEGYTPPNGTISGRLATGEGAPVIGTGVCLEPGLDQAVMFDGLAGRGVAPVFGLMPTAFTIEAWFNSDGIDMWRPVLGIEGPPRTDGQSNEIVIHAGPSPDGTARRTGLRMRNADGPSLNIGSFDLAPGWHHVAATHSGSEVNWYVNGSLISTQPFAAPSAADGDFQIGGMPNYNYAFGPSAPAFDGRVDDVRVWSRVLTSDEIADSFEDARPLTGDEPDLYAYWAMEQGTGRILTDLTSGGRHATLQGGAEWTRQGAPLNTCAESDGSGNYTFAGLRYGESTSFNITPTDSTRQFTPGTRTATLTPASPTENQMDFTDTSAFTVRGLVVHEADDSWGNQDDLPAPEIEILVDGTVAATSESDGTFAVAVRGSGQHVIEARSETFPGLAFRAEIGAQTYSDGTAELAVTRDLDGLRFTNTTSRELRGRAAGGCDRAIGDLTFRIYTEDRRFDQTFTTADSAPYALLLPPLEYRLEFEDIDDIPETLDRAAVVRYFRNLGVLEADLTTEADTVDFRYRAPIVLAVEGLTPPASTCVSQGSYTVVDADGNPRQSIPAVPVIAEYDRVPLTIRAYEDYGNGEICPVDMGTVQIFDGFADAPEPIAVDLEDGVAQYTTFGRSPDTFSGRTVGGVDRSYQKSLTAVLEVPDGPSVTETIWAVVEGYREKPATFVTATMSEIPVMILRDPPGSESSAFVEEESRSCTAISSVNAFNGANGVQYDLKIGFKTILGLGLAIETGGGFNLQSTTLIGGGITQTNGPPESNMQVCATTTERWETSGDTGWSGEDLYAGTGLNLVFAEADVVAADGAACTVQLSTTVATDLDATDPFETTFVYGTTHIKETLIPRLEDLARLAGDDTVIEGEESGEAPASVTIRKAIENWDGMLAYNDSLVTEALSVDVENRSFSAGSSYSFGTVADTTYTTSREQRVTFSSDIRIGGLLTVGGFDNFILGAVQLSTEQRFGVDTENSTSHAVGYTLTDGDAGDYFSVDTARDPRYGTYVFNTVSGASSNPWEPNTQKRDNPLLDIDPPVRDGIPEGDAAIFTLQLTNASESNERREYVLDVPPHLNPDGVAVKLNGAILSEKRVLIDPNQTISFPITVERGPEADTSDVAIIAYSPFDHAIWRTAPQLGLVTADTARFQVRFVSGVAPVTLLEPEDGWAVTTDPASDSLRLTLADITVAPLASEQLGVEVRRPDGDWQNVFSVNGDDLTGPSYSLVWGPPVTMPDGSYEVRAFAQRSGSTAPRYNGPPIPGVIDRTGPLVFGLPQPADGLLRLGEVIGLTFEEPLDCARLRQEHQSGISGPLAELMAASGPIQTDIGCVDNALVLAPQDVSAWLAVEGQLVTARIKGVRDLAGNLMQPVGTPTTGWGAEWRFTVRRNAFGWTPAIVAVNAQPDVPADLPAALVNGRAQPVDYTLVAQNPTGLPFTFTETTTGAEVRVTTSPLSGAVVSGDVQPVVFRWPGAPVGTYTSTILVEGTEAGTSLGQTPLEVTVQVSCSAPLWAVNPAAYETSMTITADLQMAGASSADPADLLAAYVDGELRGVGTLNGTTGRFDLVVYGPGPAEVVTFQAWDDSECALHTSTSRVIEYAPGTMLGTAGSPFVIVAPGEGGPALDVPLAEGWTWVSTNREGNETLAQALVGVGSSPTDQIKSPDQNAFSQYVPGTGWAGDVAGMDLGEGYLIFLDQPATMRHPGALADPTLPIPLVMGWNWVGYLPASPLTLDDALASVTFEAGDAVKSQTAYAQYSSTAGWEGSLEEMAPGLGYQFFVQDDHVLTYPAPTLALAGDPAKARPVRRMDRVPVYAEARMVASRATPAAPSSAVGNRRAASSRGVSRSASGTRSADTSKGGSPLAVGYEHSMTLTATLDQAPTDLWIAAFVSDGDGEVLRGLAPVRQVDALGGPRAYLLISGTSVPETVTLRVGTVGTDGVFVPMDGEVSFLNGVPESGSTDPVPAVFAYRRDAAWGTPDVPVVLSTQVVTAGEGPTVPSVLELAAVRPNPFASAAVFEFALPSASPVRLSVYDMLGREVAVLVDGDRAAGRHEVRVDGRAMAAGTYVARLVAGDEARVRTFIVAR